MLWYSLEVSRQGAANEYPQHVIAEKQEKYFCGYPLLSGALKLMRALDRYLGVPVFIEIVNTCDTSAITIWVINMPNKLRRVTGIHCHHCL